MSCDELVVLFRPMRESKIVRVSFGSCGMCAFHKRNELYCELYKCVYDVVVKSSRSLSHLLMSFLFQGL